MNEIKKISLLEFLEETPLYTKCSVELPDNLDVIDYITEGEYFSIIIWEAGDSGEYLQGDSKECNFLPEPSMLVIVYETTIEDFIPFIIIGVVIICVIGGIVGIVIHSKNKKNREQELRQELRKTENLEGQQ